MDLPTYTNIWRIEKRLYKLYDFRLPAPLPITWIGVFVGITVPYVVFLIAVGLPFNHTLVWLYILPPGVLTWLTTRPVIENKRLPELVSSQLRYIAEPRTWCRMAPFAEKDEILVTARVWRQHPPKARPKKIQKLTAKARPSAPVWPVPAEESPQALAHPVVVRPAAMLLASAQQTASPPVTSPSSGSAAPPPAAQVPVPERASARRTPKQAKAQPNAEPSWSPWPRVSDSDTTVTGSAAESGPEPDRRPPWMISPQLSGAPDAKAPEVAHDSDPGVRGLGGSHAPFGPTSWPSPDANLLPLLRPAPELTPFPDAGPFPEIGPFPEASPFPESGPGPEPGAGHGPDLATSTEPAAGSEPSIGAEYGSESATGSARRPRTGLIPGLGRKPGRAPGFVAPPPPAEASLPAEASPHATLAWLQVPAMLAKPRARWMLRVQSRSAAAPAMDRPKPTWPPSALPVPSAPASPAPAASASASAPADTARHAEAATSAPAAAASSPLAPPAATPSPAGSLPQTREPAPEPPASPAAAAAGPAATDAPASEADTTEAEVPAPEVPASPTPAPEVPPSATWVSPEPVPATPEPVPAEPESVPATPEPAPAEHMPASQTPAPAPAVPAPIMPVPLAAPVPPAAPAPASARFVSVERERPLPSIERALSGPGSRDEVSWRRQVKVVAGGQGPGKPDPETLDRDRVRLPLAGPRRIAVLGCTRGAGQTVTTLMTGHILAAVRGQDVAALDLNPGATSLATRRAPTTSVQALLAGQEPSLRPGRGSGARLDVIADLRGNNDAHALGGNDFRRLADLLAERYPLTMIDPAPSGLTRVLIAADQLVLIAPASPDAATSLANTQQWLSAHGYGELVSRAVTVINGVSRRTREDVLRAESVARGRCRAIVRVPWDDHLSVRPGSSSTLHPQTRLAYTALAGVLVAGMTADPSSHVPGRNPGEHSD